MTFEEVAAQARAQKERYVEQIADRVLFAATLSLKADFIERIFNKGLDSNDAKIGTYSTTPIYASKEQFANKGAFRAVGKNGTKTTKVSDVKTRKSKKVAIKEDFTERTSMYLKGGYNQLRQIQSRQVPDKNFFYTGSLSLNVAAGQISEGVYGVFLISEKESIKRKALERQAGKSVFSISPKDREAFAIAVNEEINVIMQEL